MERWAIFDRDGTLFPGVGTYRVRTTAGLEDREMVIEI
jgi:hypothetical protein